MYSSLLSSFETALLCLPAELKQLVGTLLGGQGGSGVSLEQVRRAASAWIPGYVARSGAVWSLFMVHVNGLLVAHFRKYLKQCLVHHLEESAGRKKHDFLLIWRLFAKTEGSTEGHIKAAAYNKPLKVHVSKIVCRKDKIQACTFWMFYVLPASLAHFLHIATLTRPSDEASASVKTENSCFPNDVMEM